MPLGIMRRAANTESDEEDAKSEKEAGKRSAVPGSATENKDDAPPGPSEKRIQ